MDIKMAYLLGMVLGNGEIHAKRNETCISIRIPFKNLQTETGEDVLLCVKASVLDIYRMLNPLVNNVLQDEIQKHSVIISFWQDNGSYIVKEITHLTGRAYSHSFMRIAPEAFNYTIDEKINLLKGFADVTGYVRKSNCAFSSKGANRVYLEVPQNFFLVADISNMLKSISVPIQSIDWGHPNFRDPQLKKYYSGHPDFWKKEHQIKIYANEFTKIGFNIVHKQQALDLFADENIKSGLSSKSHKFYWEMRSSSKIKPIHPGENDTFLPSAIRGKHFNSWMELANLLGYKK